MVTFRKSLLLLAIIAMMATAANAQLQGPPFTCNANAGVPPLVRAEGLAELVGDVVLSCTGGTPTVLNQPVPRMNFRIFLNTNVTSRLLSSPFNEALLMIDDPTPVEQNLCGNASGCSINGVGQEPGVDYGTVPNVYQGLPVFGNTQSDGGNTVEWLGVPIDPPGTQATRIVRITNVRANAAQLGVGGLLIPSQLIMYISVTGTQSMPINNPQQIVAFVQQGMTFSAGDASFLQCEDPDEGSGNPVALTFEELFATAFERMNVDTNPDSPTAAGPQNVPGGLYNTESGFYAPNILAEAGLASQGTRLVAHFKGIPDGVDLAVSAINEPDVCITKTSIPCYNTLATLVTGADANGAGGTPMTFASAAVSAPVAVSLSGNAGTATWEVTKDTPHRADDVMFYVWIDYTPNSSAGIPALGSGAVAGSYGPLSTVGVATSADLQPRFEDRSEDEPFMTINSCATNLLWPYVTNAAGFDTGLVISNTSMDPFGTATQEGSCTINYYGSSAGGNPPPADTTPEIGAGGHAVWTLSSGGGVRPYGKPLEGVINSAPGFQGYVIAQCLFQYAHGYGFISDLGAQKVAQGYIALVMDSPIWGCHECGLTRTKTKSEPLNQ